MAYDKTNSPISDSDATYDYRTHRYVLTADYIKDVFEEDMDVLTGSELKTAAFLNEISRQVYRWMYSQLINNSRPVLEYLISKDYDKREAMIQAMGEQFRYARVSGGNLISHQSGINPETGTIISAEDIRNMKVSEEVKEVLNTMGMTNQRISFIIPTDQTRADKSNGYVGDY